MDTKNPTRAFRAHRRQPCAAPHLKSGLLAALILLGVGSSLPSRGGEARAQTALWVRTVAGARLEGVPVGLEPGPGGDALVLSDGARRQTVPLSEIVTIRPAGPRLSRSAVGGESSASPVTRVLVELVNGDRLFGTLRGGDEDQLELDSASLGPVSIDIDSLRGLSLGRDGRPPVSLESYGDRPGVDQDVLYRRLENGIDSLSGTLDAFTAEGFTFDCALGLISFPFDEIAALSLAPVFDELPVAKRPVQVDLADRGSLHGELLDFSAGSLKLEPIFGEPRSIPLGQLVVIRFSGPGYAWLSDLEPVSVEEVPFVGGPEFFRFPWHRDRSVTGEPLVVAGQWYTKGLGVHSRSRLTYDLSAGWSHFETALGACDEVLALRHPGSMVFRVLVDGRAAFESGEIRGGDPLVEVPRLDIKGARRLTLELDFGEEFDVADRGAWIEPLLIK